MKMYKYLSVLFIAGLSFSCVQEPSGGTGDPNNAEMVELQNKIDQLELDNAMKDSVINESLAFFNEIKSNLEAIGIRKDEIRELSSNPEISNDDKEWILEEIKHINYLREENANNLRRLQKQVSESGVKIKELEIMIESLMKDIQWKDEQIAMLQDELHQLDHEYSKLFDAYQEQAIQMDLIKDELNSVYYAYGTDKELIDNGVIDKKNGFLGMGKKIELKEDFNDKYFTKVDATKKKILYIEGEDIRFITYHPKSSYSSAVEGRRTKITIKDASEFWKISKYLVVIVE